MQKTLLLALIATAMSGHGKAGGTRQMSGALDNVRRLPLKGERQGDDDLERALPRCGLVGDGGTLT